MDISADYSLNKPSLSSSVSSSVNVVAHKTPHWIKVFVFDLDNKKQIREWTKDLGTDGVRRWLSDVTLWATSKHYSIEIVNKVDA